MSKTHTLSRFIAGAAVFGTVCLVPEAGAQTEQRSAALDEITVTARRQEESLQQIPVAVTALSGNLLDKLNVVDATKLGQLVPNVMITQQTSSLNAAQVYIRGIGQNEPAANAEAGVGIYMDGVYIARTAGALFDLVDLERIEVLRGPQGTLFGRNTTGGAVQLVSKKPTDEFGVDLKAGYGRFSDWYARGRIDTGLLGGSGVKATIAYMHRERDGYFNNRLASGKDDPGSLKADSVWVGLHGDFGERFSADLTFDYGKRKGSPVFFQMVAATDDVRNYYGQSPSHGGAPFVITSKRLNSGEQSSFDGRFYSEGEVKGSGLTLEYALNDALSLKSIMAYRTFEQDTICALTGNGVMRGETGYLDEFYAYHSTGVADLNGPYTCNNAPQNQHQFSEELQILGGTERWKYVAGLFYFKEKASEYNRQRLTYVLPSFLSPPGGAGMNLYPLSAFGGSTKSKAAFGQVNYRPVILDDKLEISVGARYTEDEKSFWSANFAEKPSKSFSNTSWLLSANYQFTDDVMGYARVSTGYKAGGFSPRAEMPSSFGAEKATAYEAGLKTEWWDKRVRANLAVYRTDYDDMQVSQFLANTAGSAATIVNAGEAQFKGFELELAAAVTTGLTLTADWGYTDPEYKKYMYRDRFTNELIDISKEARFVQLTKSNWHIGAEYVFPQLSFGELSVRLDYSQSSKRYMFAVDRDTPFNPEIRDPGRKNLSARVALADMQLGNGGTWEIGVWGDNLTNHDNVGDGIDFGDLGFAGKYWLEPRRYGIDAKMSF